MSQMKKLNLIISHSDLVNVISELIELECIEPTEPEIMFDPPELESVVGREVLELENYDANFESIILLTTQYTYVLAGWLPTVFEGTLTAMLSKYTCAWEIKNLTSLEADSGPIMLKQPQLFAKMRSGGRRIFVPLAKAHI